AGGIDVFKSTNGGTTLTQKSYWNHWYFGVTPPGGPEGPPDYVHADQHSITYHPINPNIVYLGTDGGVFRSTDGGETFAGCNGGFQTTQFYSQFASSSTSSNIGIGGLQDNATAIYLGTDAWKRVIGGDGCACGINPNNQNIMYGTYTYLTLYKSTNLGDNFSGITPPNSSGAGFYAPFVVCRSNPNILYAGSNFVHKSTNEGSGWTIVNGGQSLDGNPLLAMTVSNFSTDTLYVTTSPISSRGNVFVSFNGGTSWTNITGILPDRYLTDIAIAPYNASIVYVTVAGYGSSHLFKSTNAGQSWTDVGSSLPDAPGYSVIVDPENQNNVFFGNDITVYASTDAGNSWFEYSNGLPEASFIYDLNIVNVNHRLRVATHGNGVYEADIDLVVPVELVSFTAKNENNKIKLNWSTATELNNNGFEIERSIDNKEFITRGFVKGFGTSTEPHDYTFTEDALNGKLYYRLKQIDYNGDYNYSNIIEINSFYASNFELLQNFPNPFNPTTKIKFTIASVVASESKQSHQVTLKVFDILGNEIAILVNEEKPIGSYEVEFDGKSLPSGIYYYQLKAGNFVEAKKMILLK
ncbi:MAG: T9SS type A sorting domain-containing protein, partial [Nitrososphaerales archaeon]